MKHIRARHAGGQITVEYAVMFAAIVAVIVVAAVRLIKPSVNRFYNATSNVIDSATEDLRNRT